jgi:hypothetical protein
MTSVRNLSILSLALSLYIVGQVFDLPSISVPFSLFIVGVFIGVIRKPYNYYLYIVTVLAELPNVAISYGQMLITLDAEIKALVGTIMVFMKQETTMTTIAETQSWWMPIYMISVGGIFIWIIVDTVKAFIKNPRLFIIISSYPLFVLTFGFSFMTLYMFTLLPSLVSYVSTTTPIPTLEQMVDFIVPMCRNLFINVLLFINIVSIVLAYIYAYAVARELKIYKRLGIGA